MITVSAPGKVHLIGEHSVVYGEPAIIAAIGKRCYVEAEKSDKVKIANRELNKNIAFEIKDILSFTQEVSELWERCHEKGNFSELFSKMKQDGLNYAKVAVGKTLKSIGVNGGVELKIKSDIPFGSGVGSGAALAVAVVKAISELYGKKLSDDETNKIAFEIEKIAHGTPSGGDNAACCYGGLIWFEKKINGNNIRSLKEDVPYRLENFVLVYIKKSERSTGEMVQLVRNLEENYRNLRIKNLGKLTSEMLDALKNRNFVTMKEIINETQRNLAELGVSTMEIDELAFAVREIGGAAKLCGAGGGGIVLCYHENRSKLIEAIRNMNYKPIEVQLGVDGVRVES